MDQRRFTLLEALKTGALHAGEIRMYRRGKLPGLFDQHTRLNSEIAADALRDGLLEIVRVELVGKADVEWVRVTQKGLDFLLQAESPTRALEELQAILAINEAGMPAWIADMQNQLDQMTRQFLSEVTAMRHKIDQLSKRAHDAIKRAELAQPTATVWAHDALTVLERRQQVGLGSRCSLRDLFGALLATHHNLTIRDFHQGLKRMQEKGLLVLWADVPNGEAPGPEYALLDGATVYYYVGRAE